MSNPTIDAIREVYPRLIEDVAAIRYLVEEQQRYISMSNLFNQVKTEYGSFNLFKEDISRRAKEENISAHLLNFIMEDIEVSVFRYPDADHVPQLESVIEDTKQDIADKISSIKLYDTPIGFPVINGMYHKEFPGEGVSINTPYIIEILSPDNDCGIEVISDLILGDYFLGFEDEMVTKFENKGMLTLKPAKANNYVALGSDNKLLGVEALENVLQNIHYQVIIGIKDEREITLT